MSPNIRMNPKTRRKEIFLQKLSEFVQHPGGKIRYNEDIGEYDTKGGIEMKLVLIIGVMAAFISAIFTAGYNDKPGTK